MDNPSDEEIKRLLQQYRRVAVVGLSDRPDRPSHGVAAYLQRVGYEITPVNPTITTTLGVPAVPDLQAVPPPVEIVDVFRRPEDVPPVAEGAIRRGGQGALAPGGDRQRGGRRAGPRRGADCGAGPLHAEGAPAPPRRLSRPAGLASDPEAARTTPWRAIVCAPSSV